MSCARRSFAEHGWAGTTVRSIAREAQVDPALVHYYFGSKEELLDVCTAPPPRWIESVAAAVATPIRQRGTAIVRSSLWVWSQPDIAEVLRSILLTATHEHRTQDKLRRIVTMSLIQATADELNDEERLTRASLVASHIIGLSLMRYVWKIEPLASQSDDEIVELVSPASSAKPLARESPVTDSSRPALRLRTARGARWPTPRS